MMIIGLGLMLIATLIQAQVLPIVLPQLIGGVVFGAGFVVAGLCPGTSCVAAATGRVDGLFVVLGMFSGVLVTGLAFAPLLSFYTST